MREKLNKIQAILKKSKSLGVHLANRIKVEGNKAMLTDGRRFVLIDNVGLEDGVIGEGEFPLYKEDIEKAFVIGEWDIDIAAYCSEYNLMKESHVIRFNGEFVHYCKGTECVANIERAKVAEISSEFFADCVRFHRILSGKREKSCVFKMKIVEVLGGHKRVIIEKGDLQIIIASYATNCYYAEGVVIDYQLESKKVF